VQIDGVARGTTPLTVSQVRAGLHRVRISHKGYRPVVRTLTVQPGKRIALGVSLPVQPAPAAAQPAPTPAPSRPTVAPLELGKVAPQFTAKDRVGVIYRTTDYRGQKLLLVFVQTLDANAQRIIRELNAMRAGGTRQAVVVVVLRPDRAAIRKFVQAEQIQIPVLFGTEQLARAYGVAGQPAVLYLVAEDGRVAARQVGRVNPGAVLN
jgi:peroxiredoxin